MHHWHNGLDAALDITVISSLQHSLVAKVAEDPLEALTHAMTRKNNQSLEDCAKEGIKFFAVPLEALGGFSTQSVEIVSRLAKQLARHTSRDESEVINHLFQRLSVMLMKANAALFTSRIPALPPPNS